MRAEIVAVGSELLTPYFQDSNSLVVTERLNQAGCEVRLKTIVGDNVEEIAALLSQAFRRSDLIIVTGGLGPTQDDLTRPAVATALGRRIVLDPDVLDALRARFASRGYTMSSNNERQAEVIEGAELLANGVGTAPGMWLEEGRANIALLPGPPRELVPMLESQVLPRIQAKASGRRLVARSLRIIGLTESEVDSRVAPLYQRYSGVETIILASGGYIGIRLQQWLEPGNRALEIEELAGRIQAELGTAIFTASDESLEEVVGRMLQQAHLTLAVAESCTAGMLGARITHVPGSSAYFLGGILCYNNQAKVDLCGVSPDVLQQHGAVSAQTAEALALGVRRILGSRIGLSVTGIAGPGGGSIEKPVGLVHAALSHDEDIRHAHRVLPGDRQTIRERSAIMALSLLRSHLLSAAERNKP